MATAVADGLGMFNIPDPAPAARLTQELSPSPSLSILANAPGTFEGRTLGVLASDDTDPAVLTSIRAVVEAAGATMELIAPTIGGIITTDGEVHPAQKKIDGGPSVLYDAVAVIASTGGAAWLAMHAPALDFVRDAHAHCKFVGYTQSSIELFERAGLSDQFDDGYVELTAKRASAQEFIDACASLRCWEREPATRWSPALAE
jgi:catalase